MIDFDEKMKEVKQWENKVGLDVFEDSEFLVNGIKIIDENRLVIKAFVNVYLKDGKLFSAQIEFVANQR